MSYCTLCQESITGKYVLPFTLEGERQCDIHTYHKDCWINILSVTNWCILCTSITKSSVYAKKPRCFVCRHKCKDRADFSEHFSGNHKIKACRVCRVGVVKDASEEHKSHCYDGYVKCPAVSCTTIIKASIVNDALSDGNGSKIDEHHICRQMYRCATCNMPFVESDQLAKHAQTCFGDSRQRIPRKASLACKADIEFIVSRGRHKTTHSEYVCPFKCHSLINESLYYRWKDKDPTISDAIADHHDCPKVTFCITCKTTISPALRKPHN